MVHDHYSVRTLMNLKGCSHLRRPNYLSRRQGSARERGNGVGLISWIVVGLIAGLLAKWFMPGTGPSVFIVTVLIAMAGASIGGFIVRLLGGTGATGFNVWSILLFLYGMIDRRTA
jgi:uncharacterized membrane protein YeaQ/YmgE (transglycosylase-associated protein family)